MFLDWICFMFCLLCKKQQTFKNKLQKWSWNCQAVSNIKRRTQWHYIWLFIFTNQTVANCELVCKKWYKRSLHITFLIQYVQWTYIPYHWYSAADIHWPELPTMVQVSIYLIFLIVYLTSNIIMLNFYFRVISISMVFLNKYLLSSQDLKVNLLVKRTAILLISIHCLCFS